MLLGYHRDRVECTVKGVSVKREKGIYCKLYKKERETGG